MQMPNDPVVWIIAILVAGVVVLVALVLGGKVEVGLDPLRLSFKRRQASGREKIDVLEGAELEEMDVGDVTGEVRGAGTGEEGRVTDISVARGAKFKGGKVGDITGRRLSGGDTKATPKKPKGGSESDG